MILEARAKINLTLEVLGKRADGYHEIRSVLRTLALHDRLSIEPATDLTVECDVPGLAGPQNLAYRAAVALRQATGYRGGAHITIAKSIPVAAGLGGGSSDAAATLRGLNELWATGLGRGELADLAAGLGSDVPFFLYGGTALAAGRGERIRPLAEPADCPVLLLRPPLAVSTAAIYGAVGASDYGDGGGSERLAALPPGAEPARWPLVNALQPVTCRAYPIVAVVLEFLARGGALRCLMSGSGPTCFGLFAGEDLAGDVAERARARGWDARLTHFAAADPL